MPESSAGGAVGALAFDVYGTLVDPIRVWTRLQEYVPEHAQRIAELWRQKQLEYSFRLTVMERYQDFEWVTARALEFALATTGAAPGPERVASLLAQYDDLEPFPDVVAGLEALKRLGLPMVVFSNGSPRMLAAILASSGLAGFFDDVVSVHDVGAFKPSPRVYEHLLTRLGRAAGEVVLVSSNAFDVIGAEAVGLRPAWVNRAGAPFDPIAAPPPLVVKSLGDLAERLQAG
ncbi:MAG: haloacid dehalogenase type II [Chloroflexota bacterium]